MKNTAQIGLPKTIAIVFGTTGLFTALYLITGTAFPQLPTLLIFCILGGLFLMPVEWFLMLRQSKKDYGKYSLGAALIGQEKQPIIKTIFFALLLFGAAGIFSFTIQPLENMLLSALREKLLSFLPIGFDWNNIEYIKNDAQEYVDDYVNYLSGNSTKYDKKEFERIYQYSTLQYFHKELGIK